jgi:DNA-binding MarR family transcriptional regulator
MMQSGTAAVMTDMSDLPLQSFLTYRLARLNAALNRQAGQILQKNGPLKIPEWRLIALLAVHGEMNGRMIGDIAGLDAGLASRTLHGLEQRGLIACHRRGEDRRTVWARLTPEGDALHARIRPQMQHRQERLLAALVPEERLAVFRIVEKLMLSVEGDLAEEKQP